MKKFLSVIGILLVVLVAIDMIVFKEDGMFNQLGLTGKYKKIENANELPIALEVDSLAPNFSLVDLEGNEVQLSDYRGKKLLVNFWATWCPPCKDEMPYMQEMYEKYQDDGFEILAVNSTITEKSKEDVAKFISDYELTFTIPMDEKNRVSSDYEIMAYPTSYFIDSDGVIRSITVGGMTKEHLEGEIKKLP
ncbi:redoxin domain-containing protein [Mesobacillus maritimus]|uniref:redoxin domain-containing protein n=1 Tax=Mesobacillus maritimus TaxID=1643336 RepID=UPI00203D1B1A|nr:redoxin domain-containing protein [Mesobacillus maritimus]MCM3588048.1 redoxin domain-containing protein [Mesobacillus maritimus]